MALYTGCSCLGTPNYHETFNKPDFRPQFEQTEFGPFIKAPDSPYVARGGRKQLYYIDTRQDPETAAHIKEQIERASVADPDEYLFIDAETVTASLKNADDGRTVFTWDPPYGRVLWAHLFNKRRPELNLPIHAPARGWEVTFDPDTSLAVDKSFRLSKRFKCTDYGCHRSSDCLRQTGSVCDYCDGGLVDNECTIRVANAIHICHRLCGRKVDISRLEGESDTDYYQRMDVLHWGVEHVDTADATLDASQS